ncbi:MAG: STAS domain-containing protein [Candidatus Kapaibacterium sp.]
MEIISAKKGDFTIVSPKGRLDVTSSVEFDKELGEITKSEKSIIVDCSELEYISSTGLRVFLSYLKKIGAAGGKFHICALNDNLKEIFDISGFTKIFKIFDSCEEAISH